MKVLITGGAGFIGRRLALRLIAEGSTVTVLDNLSPQIHGAAASGFPAELLDLESCRCIRGDVCDRETLALAVADQEVIVHLAAETGTGQSMYAIRRYGETNLQGTATLLDILVNDRSKSLRKLIVASSRAVYGEGRYECRLDGVVYPKARTAEAMAARRFEPECPICGHEVSVLPTSEEVPFAPASFYGLTKQVQEQMILMFGGTLGVDALALRYQNVYGPGQSLKNPYTGILAVFSNLARQGSTLNVFEDGLESRDFVYIDDVVEATALCVRDQVRGVLPLNVGSGVRTKILDVAHSVRDYFDSNGAVQVTGAFRVGDIRHNVADIARLQALTGFEPKWTFSDGLRAFLAWAEAQDVRDVEFERSLAELRDRGLLGTGRQA